MYQSYLELVLDCHDFFSNRLFGSCNSFNVHSAHNCSDVVASIACHAGDSNSSIKDSDDIETPRQFVDEHSNSLKSSLQVDWQRTGSITGKLSLNDAINVMIVSTLLYICKTYLVKHLRNSVFLQALKLRKKDVSRLEESMWRLLYYTFSSSWLCYTCFVRRDGLSLLSVEKGNVDYRFTPDLDEYLICIIETSFYIHATYAIIFEDVWRRDSPMMLLHHIVAIFSVMSVQAFG